jgi:hypothetical protein
VQLVGPQRQFRETDFGIDAVHLHVFDTTGYIGCALAFALRKIVGLALARFSHTQGMKDVVARADLDQPLAMFGVDCAIAHADGQIFGEQRVGLTNMRIRAENKLLHWPAPSSLYKTLFSLILTIRQQLIYNRGPSLKIAHVIE